MGEARRRIVLFALATVLALAIIGCGGRVDRESRSFVERDTLSRADTTTADKTSPVPQYSLLAAGAFGRNEYRASGTAALLRNETHTVLRLQDFQIEGRPGLYVYLASDSAGADRIVIGPLQTYRGTLDYIVPQGAYAGSRDHIVIFSTESSKALASARLE